MKKGRRKLRKSSQVISYSLIFIVAFLSSFLTILIFQSKIKSESILGEFTNQSVDNYPENHLPLNNDPQVITHGSRNSKKIALTFDADMTPFMVSQIKSGNVKSSFNSSLIDLLIKTHTPATLFLSGLWIELYPIESRMLAENSLFELGNHSYSHPSFDGSCYGLIQIPNSQDIEEVGITQKLLKDLTGTENTLFRFPGGCFSFYDLSIITSAGLRVVHWDVAGEDGFNENTEQIEKNIVSKTQNGSIIVLHMNGFPTSPKTTAALQQALPLLQEKGYEFVKVSELLQIN